MWPPVPLPINPPVIPKVPRLDQRNETDSGLSDAAIAAIVFAAAACLLPLAVLLAKLCTRYR
jgi:hypothetical protein